VRTEDVEFVAGPTTHGAWLFAHGDLLVTKVNGIGATLIMTSVRAPGGDVLSIKVERLEARADALESAAAESESPSQDQPKRRRALAAKEPVSTFNAADDMLLPVQIVAHIRARGDMTFTEVPWAGRVAPGLWIESFAVRPMKKLGAQDIEYKGLTGSGFETPWLSDDKMCGTKGMAVPLVGFAARLKPGPATAGYDCEYSGYFQSGVTVGPLRNGAPCRSTVGNDPLEGIQVRLTKRLSASLPSALSPSTLAAKDSKPAKGGIRTRTDLVGRTNSSRRHSTRRP
jgi:hypothetical protein